MAPAVSIPAQICRLAAALLAGLGLGALYGALAALRRRGGAAVSLLADLFFALVFAASLFLLGMGPGGGEYRLCLPPLTLLGGWIWTALFGRAWNRVCGGASAPPPWGKSDPPRKKIFQNLQKKVYNNRK